MKLPWKTKTQLLLEQIDFLRSQVAQLQNYVLMTSPGVTIPSFPTGQEPTATAADVPMKLYTTELEEDLYWQVDNGMITEDQMKAILADAESPDEPEL